MPDVDNILRLSRIFDVSTDYLLKNGEMPSGGGVVVDNNEDDEQKKGASISFLGFDIDGDDDIVIFGGDGKYKPRNFIIKNLNSIAWLTFLIMGLGWQLWHPGWLVFLVAGLLDSLRGDFMRSRRYKNDKRQQ